MSIDLTGRVAIVTGAGRGLGRAHALALAARGAKVVVSDLADADGNLAGANAVVADIEAAGGEAVAVGANVADMEQVEAMVAETMNRWGRIDILVNNAGILRDKTFAKMSLDDFRLVIEVHVMGSVNCTKAVWDIMREQQYGRIIFTSSSSGLYGNFGQSNYGAAKMAVVGFMNTLHLEGAKYDIRVNCLAPIAGTAMTEGLLPDAVYKLLAPESVSHGVVFLASDSAPSRTILCAGGGGFAVNRDFETEGVSLLPDNLSADGIAAAWEAISATDGMRELNVGSDQTMKFAQKGAEALGIDLDG
ncbi:MAG: SDR family NAD(P)-dependent oxidoreductase [Woeseiaceae bacterium]|nr:SDR family NAD(P)-dependent oxidoreductase [Woeseiaceae bacterium]